MAKAKKKTVEKTIPTQEKKIQRDELMRVPGFSNVLPGSPAATAQRS